MQRGRGLLTSLDGNGVHLCFNRHSDFGGYLQWTHGARQSQRTEHSNPTPRREVSGVVSLNATCGSGHYPQVEHLQSSGWWDWSKRAVERVNFVV
jgi:hypothetical protein